MIELQINQLESVIVTRLKGLDKALKEIISTFLECNVNKDRKVEYSLFQGEDWSYHDRLNMEHFCENDLILREIDFLENLKLTN